MLLLDTVIFLPLGIPTFFLGSKCIGHGSPPKLSVVDISQLNLSLCLRNTSPVLYILAYEYVGFNFNLVYFPLQVKF